MIDLEKIEFEVLKNRPIEEILDSFNWKEFEETVAEIFRRNGFFVKQNFRFKTNRRYEIDVFAIRQDLIFCVDCKKWSEGRNKKSGLKSATKDQEIRMKELKKFLKKNIIAKEMLKIKPKVDYNPLIVTFLDEDLLHENNCFIVPVWKLNSFLLEIDKYLKLSF